MKLIQQQKHYLLLTRVIVLGPTPEELYGLTVYW